MAFHLFSDDRRFYALKFGNNLPDYIIFDAFMKPLRNALSVCSWVRKIRSGSLRSWLSYAVDGVDNEIMISQNGYFNILFQRQHDLRSNFTGIRDNWFHYCLTWSLSSRTKTVYLNGQVIGSETTPEGRTLGIKGYIVIGNDQDGPPGQGMSEENIFGGELYKLNFFAKELKLSEVQEMALDKCSQVEETYGDVRRVKWEKILRKRRNGDVIEIKTECLPSKLT